MENEREKNRCIVCHRALSDPASIERGIGPVCFAKKRAEGQRIENETKAEEPGPVRVGHDGQRPITEWVQ